MRFVYAVVLLALFASRAAAGPTVAFVGAEGLGAESRGGADGRVLRVTSLDDDPNDARPGSLRWAIQQAGPRVVRFAVAGNVRLKAPLIVTEPFLTLDGSDAPGDGVCLCDHSLCLRKTHDVIVRHLRLRHGDVETLKDVQASGLSRPKSSYNLDTVSVDDSKNVIFDHCSLSWSCDEVFGIVRCQNVTIQWCIIAEPLANPRIHPYGDRHAFGLNLSASTLSLHHCLIAHYAMRGPQFEANDARRGMGYDVKMEAINNVLFDYERSGSRYTTGIEDHPEEAAETRFQFQFMNNYYLNPDASKPEIEATLKHGVTDRLKVFIQGNRGPHRPTDDVDQLACVFSDRKQNIRATQSDVLAQIATHRLFTPSVPVTIESAEDAYRRVLEQAGCNTRRDAADRRIVGDVKSRRFGRVIGSQDEVGGWPNLK